MHRKISFRYRIPMKSTEYNDIERPEHTLDKISELKTDEVLVLGLSIEGMHGCWAAYTAFKKIRAALRCGVGLRCQSYAIPTMYGGIEDIRPYVDEFVRYAAENLLCHTYWLRHCRFQGPGDFSAVRRGKGTCKLCFPK